MKNWLQVGWFNGQPAYQSESGNPDSVYIMTRGSSGEYSIPHLKDKGLQLFANPYDTGLSKDTPYLVNSPEYARLLSGTGAPAYTATADPTAAQMVKNLQSPVIGNNKAGQMVRKGEDGSFFTTSGGVNQYFRNQPEITNPVAGPSPVNQAQRIDTSNAQAEASAYKKARRAERKQEEAAKKRSTQTQMPTSTGDPIQDAMNTAKNLQNSLQALADKGYGDTNIKQLPQDVDISQLPNANQPPAPPPTPTDDILGQFGISTNGSVTNTSLTDVIKQVSEAYGLTDVTKSMQDLDDKYAEDVQAINDNPWLTEGVRVKKVRSLEEKYEKKRTALIERLKLQSDVVGQAITVYQNERNYQKDLLNIALTERQRKIENDRALLTASKLMEVSPGTTLVDPFTGQVISSLPQDKNLNELTDNERALLTQFTSNPIVKDFNQVQYSKLAVDNIIARGVGGPADLALVYTFMKSLDPGSVVRETEYDSAARSGNIFQGVWARFNGYFKEEGGVLPANVRSQFQNLVNQTYKARESQYTNWRENIRGIADRQGLNPDNVTPDFSSFVGSENTGGSGGTTSGWDW